MKFPFDRIRHGALPALAAAGLLFALGSIFTSAKDRGQTEPRARPPGPLVRAEGVGAVGLVEAESEQVAVGTFVSGVAAKVTAEPGRRVHAGEVLFILDARAAAAEVAARQADLRAAEARLAQARGAAPGLRAQVSALEAAVAEAEAALSEAQDLVRMAEGVKIGATITVREMTRRRSEVAIARARARAAQARLLQGRADLAQYVTAEDRDGPTLTSAAAAVDQARAALAQAETALALHTVGAPFDATALQVNIRPGEFVPAGPASPPLVVLGRLDSLRVRAEVEEADIPRLDVKATAWGTPRGAGDRRYALRPLRVDPLVVPKTALTGAATERVDTRVLRILYEVDGAVGALYPGQQMDVFIPDLPSEAKAATHADGRP